MKRFQYRLAIVMMLASIFISQLTNSPFTPNLSPRAEEIVITICFFAFIGGAGMMLEGSSE